MSAEEHSVEVVIRNPMGFHVRPVQRFAELARVFKADVAVEVRERSVPGKSIMNLMSLGGRCGDTMKITARGGDARQCVGVLNFLTENSFFVEDGLKEGEQPLRHVKRVASMAAWFNSDIEVTLDGKSADAKEFSSLRSLDLTPTSEPEFEIHGADAEQARGAMKYLVEHCFFVEAKMAEKGGKAS